MTISPIPRFPQINKKLPTHQDLHLNVHFIKCNTLETTQISINWHLHKQIVVCSPNGVLLRNKKKHIADIYNNINESQKHVLNGEIQILKATYYMIPLI